MEEGRTALNCEKDDAPGMCRGCTLKSATVIVIVYQCAGIEWCNRAFAEKWRYFSPTPVLYCAS